MRDTSWLILAVFAAACSTPAEDEEANANTCELATDCTPEYEPTFANIHARTLAGSCATSGFACHGSVDSSGGFSLATESEAYESLVERTDGEGCSILLERLTSPAPAFQMPPGAPLSEGELCAISQWIEAGAPR